MAPTYKLLSIDMGTQDCFYRFRRDAELASTVAAPARSVEAL